MDGPPAQRVRRARAKPVTPRPTPEVLARAAAAPPRSSPPRSIRSSRPAGGPSRISPRARWASRVGDVRQPRLRASRHARRRTGVPRPTRLRARARRLRHEPPRRARGVRVHRAGRSRPEGLRVAGHAHRALRDRLHREHGLLRPRRARARHPGPGHARSGSPTRSGAARSCASATASTCSRSTIHALAARPVEDVRELLRVPTKAPGARRGRLAPVRSTSTACRRHSGVPSSNERKHDVNVNFTQIISVNGATIRRRSSSLLEQLGSRAGLVRHHGLHGHPSLADREQPGSVPDRRRVRGGRSRRVGRRRSRPQQRATRDAGEWPRACAELVNGEPEYHDYDELYRTDF